jgi:hypothetical protein
MRTVNPELDIRLYNLTEKYVRNLRLITHLQRCLHIGTHYTEGVSTSA